MLQKKIAAYFSMILLLALSSVSHAETKVGYVDIPYLIDKSPLSEKASKRLEKEFAPRQKKLKSERSLLRSKRNKLEKDGLIMSASERVELEQEIRQIERRLKRDELDFREELNIQKNNEFKKVRISILEAISSYAKSRKYDLVISDGVLFASDQVDLTEAILASLRGEKVNER